MRICTQLMFAGWLSSNWALSTASSGFLARSSRTEFDRAEGAVCGVVYKCGGVSVGPGDDLVREPVRKYRNKR